MLDLFDRKQSLPWLIALSMLTAGVGQVLLLSAAPHQTSVRSVPPILVKRLATAIKPHNPISLSSPKPAFE
jgi:hypothetical protein